MQDAPKIDAGTPTRLSPASITAVYAVAGALWILFSDRLAARMATTPDSLLRLSTAKGWFFILVTSAILYGFLDRYARMHRKQEGRLQELNRALATINKCNEALIRPLDELPLLREICRIAVEEGGYRLTWVGFAGTDERKSVRPVASAGVAEDYLESLDIRWSDAPQGMGPTGTAIRTAKPVIVQDMKANSRYDLWRAEAEKRGFSSSAAFPLLLGGEAIGALNVYSGRQDAFTPEEVEILSGLANNLALGIAGIRAREVRRTSEEEIRKLNAELEERVRDRTARLEASNRELEAFGDSVSHDLRAPLRSIDGFSRALLEDCGDRLDETGKGHIARVRAAASRMSELIDALLDLSRVTRTEMRVEPLDLSAMARGAAEEIRERYTGHAPEVVIAEGIVGRGDGRLMRLVFHNLLDNAFKFTGRTPAPRVEVGATEDPDGGKWCFVRDNGAGFDMGYADKLFGTFQRLHPDSEFPGTGVGLAIVRRIVHRHGGRVRAEGRPGGGATFGFTL